MLAPERQHRILSLLDQRGTVRTIDLAEEFDVTDETVRRDLQVLAENRQLTRIYGGACSLNGRPMLQSFIQRRAEHVESKNAIAQMALSLIQPGRTYVFDSSTTAFTLVTILPDLPYRVVTNSKAVLDHMTTMQNVELISTGGRYFRKTNTFVGGDSINTLRRHNIHTAFISCIGFDTLRGASEGFEHQATFKERLVQFAEEVVLLVDSSKFNQRSEYYFAEVGHLSKVITDSAADPGILTELRGRGVEVMIAE